MKAKLYCWCGSEIQGVRWSERYEGVETYSKRGVCCSEDEGEYSTPESAGPQVAILLASLREHSKPNGRRFVDFGSCG